MEHEIKYQGFNIVIRNNPDPYGHGLEWLISIVDCNLASAIDYSVESATESAENYIDNLLNNKPVLSDGLYCAIDECANGNDHQSLNLDIIKPDRNTILVSINTKTVYPLELQKAVNNALNLGMEYVLL